MGIKSHAHPKTFVEPAGAWFDFDYYNVGYGHVANKLGIFRPLRDSCDGRGCTGARRNGLVLGSFPVPNGFVNSSLSRRGFLVSSAVAASLGPALFAAASAKYRAAVIGDTGRGDYGHGLDVIFNDRANIEVAAVADPDDAGRAKARLKCGAAREYRDYHELLAKESPQLVSVAMRWTDPHHAICKAALEVGAHLFIEKPFTTTLAEADDLLALAQRKNLKIAVAHQMRLAPAIVALKSKLANGLIGDLLQIRAHGKQDTRAGGEDMVVLGTHLFDLMRWFTGDPLWCTAHILQKGQEVSVADAREATEKIGPVLGDEIEAQFAFPNGVHGTFTSRALNRETAGHWGIELMGSKGTVRVLADLAARIFIRKAPTWSDAGAKIEWEPLDPALAPAKEPAGRGNARLVDDWLAAIENNREPECSGRAAMKALEMVMAVYQAGLSTSRVNFPLKQREHPLLKA
jgi:predicted dehydrogenase